MKFISILIAFCLVQLMLSAYDLSKGNVIYNGHFQNNYCGLNSYCFYGQQIYLNHRVGGWLPIPQIEIGNSQLYNSDSKLQGRVVELDANGNTCIRQYFVLSFKRGLLKFNWSARNNIPLHSCQIHVIINGQRFLELMPVDYKAQTSQTQLLFINEPKNSYIEFCGAGASDGAGAVIDFVQLYPLQ